MDIAKYKKVPICDITSAKGKDVVLVLENRWWIVTADDCVLLYRNITPQCNPSKKIAEQILKKHPGCDCRFINIAFVPWHD